jgi:hypothetical protein
VKSPFQWVVWLLLVAGCSTPVAQPDNLIKQTQALLLEREAKLSRYRFGARSEQQGEQAVDFDFAYRSPDRLRARVHGFYPASAYDVITYDGHALYEVMTQPKVFRKVSLPNGAAQRALRVAERFAPYIPEGFRNPVLPWKSVEVRRVAHPRAPEAVALRATLKDEAGHPLTITYTLRWPSGDFLAKRLEGSGGLVELRMDEEQCEKRMDLCVPLQLSQYRNGVRVGGIQVLDLELFAAPPLEDFTPSPPNGYALETAEL